MTLEMMLLSKAALESKNKGRCGGCCHQTFVGPCHCQCVVTANPHFIIGEGGHVESVAAKEAMHITKSNGVASSEVVDLAYSPGQSKKKKPSTSMSAMAT